MGRIPTKTQGNGSPVQHLWEVHKQIARLHVSGMRSMDIARKLGYTESWLSTITCSPVYKKYLASLSERADDQAIDIKRQIQEGAEVGVSELLKVLKGDGEYAHNVPTSLKVKVAQDFLDRNGNAKITKVQQDNTLTILDGDRIAQLKESRARLLQHIQPTIEGELCA
jgi:hypothetical protein